MSHAAAIRRLTAEFQALTTAPVDGIVARPTRGRSTADAWRDDAPGASAGDVDLFSWVFALSGPPGSVYEGGVFHGVLTFPSDYPLSPPRMVFSDALWHPNVYGEGPKRGEVCISILHVGRDVTGYEQDSERWSCVHSIRSVLLSVTSILAEPNAESPANVDAANMMLRDPAAFKARGAADAQRSLLTV